MEQPNARGRGLTLSRLQVLVATVALLANVCVPMCHQIVAQAAGLSAAITSTPPNHNLQPHLTNATTFTQTAEITPTSPIANEQFGWSVSLSGDGNTALMGSVGGNIAYIFTNRNGTWSQTAVLTATATTNFGYAVSLSKDGNTALVGDAGGNAAYIFNRNNGIWSQTQKLTAVSAANLGYAVSLSGDGSTALISDPNKSAVFVFTNTNQVWGQPKEIDGSVSFGNALSLSDDGKTALIGDAGSYSYIYNYTSGTWSQTAALNTASNLNFGISVSLSGDGKTALIGDNANNAAYIFNDNSGTWGLTPAQTLTATGTSNFGYAVSLSRDKSTALIGAPGNNDSFVFTNAGSSWSESQILTPTDTVNSDEFGDAVSLSSNGGIALMGANAKNANVGAAYIFSNSSAALYNYYLPLVANNANNFTTYLAFQNIGTTAANVTVTYFNSAGVTLTASTFVTQVAQYGEVLPSNPFANNTSGTGIITSNQPLNVIVPEATPVGGSAYAVVSGSSDSLVAPFALHNAFGDFTTQLNIFNGGSNPVTATITFYGTVSGSSSITNSTTTVSIAAHTTANVNQNSLPSGFSGWARITGTDNTLVAQVLEQSSNTHFVAIANAIVNASSNLYAPAIFNGGYGSFYTGANIINPNANVVTVTLTYYDLTSNAIPTAAFTIPAYGVASIYNGSSGGNGLPNGGLPSNFVGAVVVNTVGGGIVMSVNENGGLTSAGNSRSGTYAAIANGGNVVGLPVVSYGGYSYITGNTIFNTSSQTVTGTITYYNTNGTSVGISKNFTIAGHGSQAYYQGDGSLPVNFYGTAVITEANGSPANALIVTTNAQNIALFYTYSEPNS